MKRGETRLCRLVVDALALALREGLEVQELAPHHHEIAPRKQLAHQRTRHPARVAHDEFGEEPECSGPSGTIGYV